MKRLFSILVLAGLTSLMACGDEESDPQPVKTEKTDLELVKEGIVGTWELNSITVTNDSKDYVFNGGCEESSYPQEVRANLEDIDFKFEAGTKSIQILNCQDKSVEDTYSIKTLNGKFIVTTGNGWEFEIITPIKDLTKKTIQVNSGMRLQGVEKVVMSFTLK